MPQSKKLKLAAVGPVHQEWRRGMVRSEMTWGWLVTMSCSDTDSAVQRF